MAVLIIAKRFCLSKAVPGRVLRCTELSVPKMAYLVQWDKSEFGKFLMYRDCLLEFNYMRAKTVKFCENLFLYAEEGCTLCYVGVLILSTSLAPISKRLFLHSLVHCVFLW